MKRIYLSPPHMGGAEIEYIQQAFAANWVAPIGPNLDAFEKSLADYSGVPFCAAVSSGTAAIHLALMILGVKRGDEVICSTFTFSGSCNPIVYTNASPIFVDSERDTWNMDPAMLKAAIDDRLRHGKKPAAIILVHLYGMPAKVDQIMHIAKEYNIPVIEDAAEALGSSYKGKPLGSFGDFGIYSFNGNKIITTSGGGALLSSNETWIRQARFLATQARDPAPHYEHSAIGFNYRLSNILAGIGIGQMQVINQRVEKRRANFQKYVERLSMLPGLEFQPEVEESFSNRWLTCCLFPANGNITPEDIRLTLESSNIESRPLWKPMHMQPIFKDALYFGSGVSDDLFSRGLCLPSGSNLSNDEIDQIANSVTAKWTN